MSRKLTRIEDLEALTIWPTLFRRLVTYFKDNEGLASFDTWVRAKADRDDELRVLSKGELAKLHDVVEVKGSQLRMRFPPADLIIVPR